MTLDKAIDLPIYTIADAGRIARTPRRTVSEWVRAGVLVRPREEVLRYSAVLTFEDLISLLTVRELRRAGVHIETIKHAEANLSRLWGVPKPFAHGRFKTGYGAIITTLQERERPVAVGHAIQEIHYELIERELQNVSYDVDQRASRWQPVRYIVLEPDVQLGQPCIEGTRVTTRTVYQFVAGGESFEELAEDLGIDVERLRAAYEYEETLWKRLN